MEKKCLICDVSESKEPLFLQDDGSYWCQGCANEADTNDFDEEPEVECGDCGYPVFSSDCPSCTPEYYERG